MNSKIFATFTQILGYLIKYFKLVVLAAVILGVLTGVYRVESNEAAIVLRFGRLVGDIPSEQVKQPGIHFALPFFIDRVVKIPIHTVHEKEVVTHFTTGNEGGLSSQANSSADSAGPDNSLLNLSSSFDSGNGTPAAESVAPPVESKGYLLTGDVNIVQIKAVVKYRIGNPTDYALYSCDVNKAIDGVISAELTRLVTHMDIDTVLTSGKAQLASAIMVGSQPILDQIKTGVIITNLEFTDIVPPAQTKQAFEEVISASVNKEAAIQAARQSASSTILEAEAIANNYTQDAIYNQSVRMTRVHNEMAEFNGLFNQYTDDPRIIINGTFRQRVSAVLKQMGGSIIVPDGNAAPTIILP